MAPFHGASAAPSRTSRRREPRQVGRRKDPEEPCSDHDRGDGHRVEEQVLPVPAREGVQDDGQLQPDEGEKQTVEDEEDDLPHRDPLEPRPRRRQFQCVPTEVDARAHRGEHARDPERVCRQIGEVAAEDRDGDLDRRVVDTASDLTDHPADREADGDPAGDAEDEVPGSGRERKAAGHDGEHRVAVRDERGAVVDQALPLDEAADPTGEPEALRDRSGGRGVRRRDDRAENERHRPREPRNDGVGDERDEHHGQQHEADRQKDDRLQVRAELAEGREEGRAVEERRQDGDENEIRGKLDLGDPRDETEGEPAEHEEDRVRGPHPLGDDDQRSRRGEEDEEDEAVFGGEHLARRRPMRARGLEPPRGSNGGWWLG